MRIAKETLKQIRDNLDWQSVFLPESATHIRCVHPDRHANGDRTPSMRVYPDGVYCFGCGAHYSDPVEFTELLKGNELSRFDLVVKWLWQQLSETAPRHEKPEPTVNTSPVADSVVGDWATNMRHKHYEWLDEKYAIDRETAVAYRLGYTGIGISIPLEDEDGAVQDVLFRNLRGTGPKYWKLPNRVTPLLFPGVALHNVVVYGPPSEVLFVEAPLDALSFYSNNKDSDICCVSLTYGTNTPLDLSMRFWQDVLQHEIPVGICMDNDAPGMEAFERICPMFRAAGFSVYKLKPNGPVKDWAEYEVYRRENA